MCPDRGRRRALDLLAGFAAYIALGIVGGCGGEPFGFLPVTGKVTYSDRSLIPGDEVILTFKPIDPQRSGSDVVGAARGYLNVRDGTCPGLTSHKHLDGAAPGRYKVVVQAMKTGPDGVPMPTAAVPQRYQDAATTPLEFEVSRGSRTFDFLIEKPR